MPIEGVLIPLIFKECVGIANKWATQRPRVIDSHPKEFVAGRFKSHHAKAWMPIDAGELFETPSPRRSLDLSLRGKPMLPLDGTACDFGVDTLDRTAR